MKEKYEYAEQWEVSSKYFYDKHYYKWMQEKIQSYKVILEIGCGTGYSTLTLLENGHKVIALDKNGECIRKAKILVQEKGYSIGDLTCNDVMFIETDVIVDKFNPEVLDSLYFDAVICWNVGTYWEKGTLQFYLPYLLEYGLSISQIKEMPESSYSELLLWNACKIAANRNVPINIIERTGIILNEENDCYYCILRDEFSFSELEYDNLQADSISRGGLMLSTNGKVNTENVIETILLSIFLK